MNHYFQILQELLLSESPYHEAFHNDLKDRQQKLVGVELAQSNVLLRASLIHQAFQKNQVGTGDLAIILRQVMRVFHSELSLQKNTWKLIQKHQHEMSLRIVDEGSELIRLRALPWECSWLSNSQNIDRLDYRRSDMPVPGDGLLYAFSTGAFWTYKSDAQKTAVAATLFASPGSTTLITLPTGGGKSMCILLPAWFESHGGRRKGGTTLVIVPTVALAHDQQRSARNYFNPANDAYKPYSLTSDTSQATRATIYKGVREGTIPILYVSPEALLLNPVLYHTCLQAAEKGNLKRFIIDEAHLVDSWGASFRTEFQLLGAYKQKLLEASQGQLRTFLLSATVSYQSESTLTKFFTSQSDLSLILANQLRPEPSYWFHYTNHWLKQRDCVIEALHHLPRPAILYVTKPNHAQHWVRILHECGFERVAAFSGQTTGAERHQILTRWNDNEIDIIVGTSAFGLGVDKSDVRTIIHATLPENIDRYYQEVGRSGRDGCSSISLLITKDDDFNLAFSMTTKSRITIEKAWLRWQGMWKNSLPYEQTINMRLINLNAKPINNPEMRDSEANRYWNEHILLFMQRAKVLSIEDTRPNEAPSSKNVQERDFYQDNFWVLVTIKDDMVVNDETAFDVLMDKQRELEKQSIDQNLTDLKEVVEMQIQPQPPHCLSSAFAELYPYTAMACGGCAYCRINQERPYSQALRATVELERWAVESTETISALQPRLGNRQSLIVVWDTEEISAMTLELIPLLIEAKIEQIILPNNLYKNSDWMFKLIERLVSHKFKRHRLLEANLLETTDFFPIPTAVFYPMNKAFLDKLYLETKAAFQPYVGKVPLIHIVHRGAWLPSENGQFVERVNGLQLTADSVKKLLQKSKASLY